MHYSTLFSGRHPLSLPDLPSSNAQNGLTVLSKELVIRKPDGHTTPALLNAAPVLGLQNRVIGAVVLIHNIAARKELDRLRQELGAALARDFRNPSHAILSGAKIILKTHSKDQFTVPRSKIHGFEQNAMRLLRMVGELADITGIEGTALKLEFRAVDVNALTNPVLERLRLAFPQTSDPV